MLFSLDWLLDLCPVERDVARIAAALTDRGLTVDSVEDAGADQVLDVDVPANRPDCLGHVGLARELAAALDTSAPTPPGPATAPPGPAVVSIDDPALCARYTAGIVRGVEVGPSPDWVVRRLEACGIRSVSNVVDASNLVMLELGQPIHFFDLRLLGKDGSGAPVIRVRKPREGETLRTLDGVDRQLCEDMLLIADDTRAVALAGVIGGADTEIGGETRDVLVEAAHFDPSSIRATSRRLSVATDASYRFERGLDPEAPPAAQALAARLLQDLAGGRAEGGIVDVYPGRAELRRLGLRESELRRLLGFELEPGSVMKALDAVGLAPTRQEPDVYGVTVPSWRGDLEREADLVEEVARHLGYDAIPASTAVCTEPAEPPAELAMEDRARDALVHLGFHEAVGYAMIGEGEDDRFVPADTPPALRLDNPIAEPLACLRRSILPGLLRAADTNLRRGTLDVRLFELGRVFLGHTAASEPPAEPLRLGLVWSGCAEPPHWSRDRRAVDLHDVIGVAEHVLDALRRGRTWKRDAGRLAALHPGRSARWTAPDGDLVAWGGALHPELRRNLDQEVLALEIDLDAVGRQTADVPRQRPVPRVPAVTRDLSLLLQGEVAYGTLMSALRSIPAPAPARFEAVDRYQGPPLDAGQTSLTIRMTLEPLEQTLTDAQTESYRMALVESLRDTLGIAIRS